MTKDINQTGCISISLPDRMQKRRDERDREEETDRKEGVELRRLAALFEEEKRQLEMKKKDERKHRMREIKQQVSDIEYMKKIDQMMEEVRSH